MDTCDSERGNENSVPKKGREIRDWVIARFTMSVLLYEDSWQF
jgi:hypothetical protein